MKKLIKIFGLLFVIAGITSCENNNDDLGFEPQEERGWIQFVEGGPDIINSNIADLETISIGVNIQVPTTSSDLTINYDLVSVSGMDPNTAFSNVGSIVSPAGQTSYMGPDNRTGINHVYLPPIDLDVSDITTELTEPMVFDVVLTGTSSNGITVGLSGENFPTTQRVRIWSAAHFAGTYTVSEQFTSGPNAPFGLSDFFGESYQVELTSVPGDSSKYIVNNSAGFNTYFLEDAELTLLSDGSATMEDSFGDVGPVVALFRVFEYTSSSYGPFEVTFSGPFSTFGPYEFVLTKQ